MSQTDLPDVDTQLLQALLLLLETGSVTTAARRLGVTQPAMSRTLARLRKIFRDPLLVPAGRHMEPTHVAKALLPRVQQALTALRLMLHPSALPSPATEHFTVRVAMSDYAVAAVLGPWMRALALDAPGVSVRVEAVRAESVQALAGGELDLAVGPRPAMQAVKEFVFKPLLEDETVCAIREKHPFARGHLTLRRYLTLGHVTISTPFPGLSTVHLALHKLQKTRRVAATVPSFLSALALVASTDLAVAVPRRLVDATKFPVVTQPLPFRLEPVRLELIWHPRMTTDLRHRWLREHLLACVRQSANSTRPNSH